MEIHDKYIIYSPPKVATQQLAEKPPLPLTSGLWQDEMLELIDLFSPKKNGFTNVNKFKKKWENGDRGCDEKTSTSTTSMDSRGKSPMKKSTGRGFPEKIEKEFWPMPKPRINGEESLKETPGEVKAETVQEPQEKTNLRIDIPSKKIGPDITEAGKNEKSIPSSPARRGLLGEEPTVDDIEKSRDARDGNTHLKPGSTLKFDHFPGIGKIDQQLEGAPNYRKIGDERFFGTGQPTIDGIRNVLEKTGAVPGSKKKAVWTNLRKESVLYINGKPFNLRKSGIKENSDKNKGKTTEQIEKEERELREEVRKEIDKNGGFLVIQDEDKNGKVFQRKIKVNKEDVKTTREVFDDLKEEGYNIDYKRVPISDEKNPEYRDLDGIRKRINGLNPEDRIIFNCHMGRGRTTTGLIIADLIRRNSDPGVDPGERISKTQALREDIKEKGSEYQNNYRKFYRGILNTLKMNPDLTNSQNHVDNSINKHDQLQNLKKSIDDLKKSAGNDPKDQKKLRDYVKRYSTVVYFNSYLMDQGADSKISFQDWMKDKSEAKESFEKYILGE